MLLCCVCIRHQKDWHTYDLVYFDFDFDYFCELLCDESVKMIEVCCVICNVCIYVLFVCLYMMIVV